MLSLDSPRWKELEHAYGVATDTPGLLRQLYSFPPSEGDSEPWFTLWSSLAHQGDVYSASFAAVPHVVDALSKGPEKVCFDYFQFPAWVEICRHNNHVTVPADLLTAYTQALRMLPTLVAVASSREWDEGFARCALAAIAAAKGAHPLAETVLELSPDVVTDFSEWLNER
jgi:hypothetical protein